jgi:hypothetical protein
MEDLAKILIVCGGIILLLFFAPKLIPMAAIIATVQGDNYYHIEDGMLVGVGSYGCSVGHSGYGAGGGTSLSLTNPTIPFTSSFTETDCSAIGGAISKNTLHPGCQVQYIENCVLVDSSAVPVDSGVVGSVDKLNTVLTLWTAILDRPGANYDSTVGVNIEVVFDCPSIRAHYPQQNPTYYCSSGSTCVEASVQAGTCYFTQAECESNLVVTTYHYCYQNSQCHVTPSTAGFSECYATSEECLSKIQTPAYYCLLNNACVSSSTNTGNCYSTLSNCQSHITTPTYYYCISGDKCVVTTTNNGCYSTLTACENVIPEEKDNTLLYIGIGLGSLIVLSMLLGGNRQK